MPHANFQLENVAWVDKHWGPPQLSLRELPWALENWCGPLEN